MPKVRPNVVGFKDRFNAADDVHFALQNFNAPATKEITPIKFTETYQKKLFTNINSFAEVKTPTGYTFKKTLDTSRRSEDTSAVVKNMAAIFANILKPSQELKDAEQKYKDAIDDLNADRDDLSYDEIKKRLAKISESLTSDLEDDYKNKRKQLKAYLKANTEDLTACFNLSTDEEAEELKKEILSNLEQNHKDCLDEAKKEPDGIEDRENENQKNLQQLAELAKLWYHEENRKFILGALKRKGLYNGPSSGFGIGHDDLDRNLLKGLTVEDVYNEIKIEGKGGLYIGGIQYIKSPMFKQRMYLEYNPETQGFSMDLPGFTIKTKVSAIIYFKVFNSIGIGTQSDEQLKESLSAQFKFYKALKDDVNINVTSVTKKDALALARIACEEALLAGFTEEGLKNISIKYGGVTEQISFNDLFKEHGSQKQNMMREVQKEDQRRHNVKAMSQKDMKNFLKDIPLRQPPKKPDAKKEEEHDEEKESRNTLRT